MWNHRIVSTVDICGCEQLELVEVFYDENHVPYAYGEASIVADSMEDIALQLDMFCSAMGKPTLNYPEDFTGKVCK